MGFFHRIEQGECLSSLAKEYGFPSFHTIYDDPKNADFRQSRPNPNVILPGDRVYIPEIREKTVSAADKARHRYRLKRSTTLLRLVVVDPAGKPLAGRAYVLTVGVKEHKGKTDSEGIIEAEIRADAARGKLEVAGRERGDAPLVRGLFLGHLDPVTEVSGVQGRLVNLGFDCGEVDGKAGPRTALAVANFQRCYGLEVDGVVGEATRGKLLEVHGS